MSGPPNVVRKGDGLPLVAIHGNGVDHRLLLALDDCLAEPGCWERIYLDLPGFGGTLPLDGTGGLPEIAEWLVDAVTDLVGERDFALLANSLGGLLARHVRARFPGRVLGVALIAPVVDADPARRTRPALAVVERDDDLLASLSVDDRDEFASIAARQVPASWVAFRDFALPGIRAADPGAMERLSRRYFLPEVPEETSPGYDGPTLIVTGRQDHVVGYQDQMRLLAHYPRATFVALDGAGHNVHLEQPDIVHALLREWSGRVRSTIGGDPGGVRSDV
ncbi:alpha/beta fold hydrolase [Micromonospora sagamiensis]|uniref:Pimeloyl-ACP methyl ester carboxylesterase n=1 Tax=Micromonospora sagamiensis TaxID=47875 RepID=A0A562WAH0_9ACTN|nr:alpha/beta hydrolase [Micromonospora sagamiensis]TWJ27222.1 pimeloyl-ACP methyl ester carboxylesterase [Micromonospora sagamiensis]BCL13883.1 hydrolase [Micromonospora sagamiensis]